MTYSLAPGLFIENGPAIQSAKAVAARSSVRFLPWRKLDADRRLKAIECALKAPANDCADALPIAL